MARRLSKTITELYAPQFEQFGFTLEADGNIYVGGVDNDQGRGSACAMPISGNCVVMEHNIVPAHNMLLSEYTPRAYACVTEINEPTRDCMPKVGIETVEVASARSACSAGERAGHGEQQEARGPWPSATVCSFLQDKCGVENSPLVAGNLYHSHSVVFFPEYFEELEGGSCSEFAGLFDAFATPWSPEASAAICTALRRLSFRRTDGAAAHLYATSIVNTMVAELAAAREAEARAARAAGTTASRQLTEEAAALAEHLLDQGRAPGVDELAARLYVSRSKLCATFRAQAGEGVAAYVRRRRIERAEELLADGRLSVGQIAERLGYPRASAFAQAFKQERGMSPSAWRAKSV